MPDIKFPSIPSPNANDVKSLAASIGAMKEILEILLGQRGDLKNKAITTSSLPAAVTAVPGLIPTDGTNGTNGVNGRDGVDGEDGWTIPGARGTAGADGLRGVPGRDGDDADSIQWLFPPNATPFVPGDYSRQVYTRGPQATYFFEDRVTGYPHAWAWYATGGIARLFSSFAGADVLQVSEAGALVVNAAIPTIQFGGVSGATKIGEMYQQGDTQVLSAAAGISNWVAVDLATGFMSYNQHTVLGSPVTSSAMYGANCTVTIANGGNAQIQSVLGLIIVRDASSTGSGAVYLVSGYGCLLIAADAAGVWVASTTTPAAGKASVAMSAGHSLIYNNTGAALTVAALVYSLA